MQKFRRRQHVLDPMTEDRRPSPPLGLLSRLQPSPRIGLTADATKAFCLNLGNVDESCRVHTPTPAAHSSEELAYADELKLAFIASLMLVLT